jgi:hypothetical protein
MLQRALVVLAAASSLVGCLSNRDLPPGGVVNCASNDECPADLVCQEGRCVDVQRSPTVNLEALARAAGEFTIGADLTDPNDGELSLTAEIVDGVDVHPLAVSPARAPAGEVELTIEALELAGPQPREVELRVYADNGEKVGFDVLTLDYGNEDPETNGLFVVFEGAAARANQVNLAFTARDSSSDPVSITGFEVSTDGGAFTALPLDNATFAEGGFEDLETSEGGVQHLVNWNTAASRTHGDVVVRMTLSDAFGGEHVVESEGVVVDNAPRIDVPVIAEQPGRPLEDVVADYFLNAPTASDGVTVDVRAEFTMNFQNAAGIDNFVDAVAHADSGPTTGLVVGDQTFRWDILASVDAPVITIRNAVGQEVEFEVPPFTDRAALRLTPVDSLGLEGEPVVIGPFALGNDAPEVALAPIENGVGGDVPVEFDLSDSAADLSSVEVEFRLNAQDSFRAAAIAAGNTANLAVGPSPAPFLVLWSSLTEPDDDVRVPQGIGRAELDEVTVRVRTFDEPRPGIRHFSGFVERTVALSNQTAPRLEPVLVADEGGARSGVIPVVFRLVDEESDPVHLAIELSTDGANFSAATEHRAPWSSGRVGLASSPAGVVHTFLWDSAADIPLGSPSAQLRARVIDAFIDPTTEPVANVNVLQPSPIDTVPDADAAQLFSRVPTAPSGGPFVGIVGGDFNADGFDDLVIGDELHLSDGLGGLVFEQTLTGVSTPLLAELNGDGVPDIVGRNSGVAFISGAGPDLLTSQGATANCGSCIFEVVDVDGDGQDDIYSTQNPGPTRIFLSVGTGASWSPQELTPSLADEAFLHAGDLDGDGAQDLVVQLFREGTVEILRGSGTPGTGAWTLSPLGGASPVRGRIRVGEMTGDDLDDLVVYDESRLRVSIFQSEGDGTLTEVSAVAGLSFGNFDDLVDIDRDGGLDLVVVSATDPALLVVRSATLGGRPVGSLLEGIRVESVDVTTVGVVGDLDGDGLNDIVTGEGVGGTGQLQFFFGQLDVPVSASSFGVPAVRSGGERDGATPVATDLDADGFLDFFLAQENGEVVLAEGNAVGAVPVSWTTPPGGGFAALDFVPSVVGDLDGDEVPDIAVQRRDFPNPCVLDIHLANADDRVPTGGHPLARSIAADGCGNPSSVDVDGDGDLDILTSDASDNVLIHLNNGDATFATSTFAAGVAITDIRVDELTGDAQPDLIIGASGDDRVVVARNLGGGSFTLQRTFVVSSPNHLHTGDVNGDGRADIFVTTTTQAIATVILGQGAGAAWNGTLSTTPFDPGFLLSIRPAFADFDLDGDLDAITVSGASQDPNHIFVAPGLGDGGLDTPFQIQSPFELGFVAGLDVSGDGAVDLFGAGLAGGALAVYTGRSSRALRSSSAPVVDDAAFGVSAFGPAADIAWVEDFGAGFRDAASIGLRPIFGADDTLAGPPVGDHLSRSGDFAKLVRLEAGVTGLGAPLTNAFYASGDVALARRADERVELTQRFGPLLDPANAFDARRAGLDLEADPPTGLVIDLPLRAGAVVNGNPIIALRVPRWRTANTVARDPLTADADASRLLPRVDDGEGPRDVVQLRYAWTLIPQVALNELTDPARTGKRFAVDLDNGRIRVVTDELGAMQAFNAP